MFALYTSVLDFTNRSYTLIYLMKTRFVLLFLSENNDCGTSEHENN